MQGQTPVHEWDPVGTDSGIPQSIPEEVGAMGEHASAQCLMWPPVGLAGADLVIPQSISEHTGAKGGCAWTLIPYFQQDLGIAQRGNSMEQSHVAESMHRHMGE